MASRLNVYRETKLWYVRWRDHNGKDRRWPGEPDRRATLEVGHKLERIAMLRRNREPFGPELTSWIMAQGAARRAAMTRVGLIGQTVARQTPLSELIDQYMDWQRDQNHHPRHISQVKHRIETVFEAVGADCIEALDATKVERYLAKRRTDDWSVRTSNTYLTACKSFLKWAERVHRIGRDVLAHVRPLNDEHDKRHKRRALTDDELAALLAATQHKDAEPFRTMTPPQRYWVYRLASELGLIPSELRTLKRSAFKLGGAPVLVTYSAKRRKTHRLPLSTKTAAGLDELFGDMKLTDRPFPLPLKTADMIRQDLAVAGVEYETADGFADFYSLRHTAGTNLARLTDIATVQALMRHATIRTTQQYLHTTADRMRDAVERRRTPHVATSP